MVWVDLPGQGCEFGLGLAGFGGLTWCLMVCCRGGFWVVCLCLGFLGLGFCGVVGII